MAQNSPPVKRKQKPNRISREDPAQELTFSYAFDCLSESAGTGGNQFLGFTLSTDYAAVHQSRSEELSKLRYYFSLEVLKAVLVYRVNEQIDPVVKWTDRNEMEIYLKQNGGT